MGRSHCHSPAQVEGKVRKARPAYYEALYTKGEDSPHIIETEYGKVGISICYEGQWSKMSKLLHHNGADILLMPHSCPTPAKSIFYSEASRIRYNKALGQTALCYAQMLGIPVVMSNKVGPWQSPTPGLPLWQESYFPGLSCIADSDGAIKKQMSKEEGFIVADVGLFLYGGRLSLYAPGFIAEAKRGNKKREVSRTKWPESRIGSGQIPGGQGRGAREISFRSSN